MSKRYVIHAAAANLGLVLRTLLGHGTPRGLAEKAAALLPFLVHFTGVAYCEPHRSLTPGVVVSHGVRRGRLRIHLLSQPIYSPGC